MNILKPAPTKAPISKSSSNNRSDVLAAWRGVDLSDAEGLRQYSPKNLTSLSKDLIARLNLPQKRAEGEIPKLWSAAMDPRIAAHAQPIGFRKGTLFVAVDHSVWLDEICRYHKREILERMQHAFGKDKIKRISFRLG